MVLGLNTMPSLQSYMPCHPFQIYIYKMQSLCTLSHHAELWHCTVLGCSLVIISHVKNTTVQTLGPIG